MKKILKTFLAVIIIMFSLVLVGCVERVQPGPDVNIQSLTAEVTEEPQLDQQTVRPVARRKMSRLGFTIDDGNDVVDENASHIQYVIIYKSETEIKFTIKLDNPKAESIDAIELTCDDPNSKIMVDGEYKPIRYTEDGKRQMNWAQEDPYEKTFYIQTTSEDDINTIKVTDIKVNGTWQGATLSNDELSIYKLNENDLKIETVLNDVDVYKFKVVHSENVTVTGFSENVVLPAEGAEEQIYSINASGKVIIKYNYTFNGVTVSWENTYDIELLHISKYLVLQSSILSEVYCAVITGQQLCIEFSGTDLKTIEFIKYDGIKFYKDTMDIGEPELYNIFKWDYNELLDSSFKEEDLSNISSDLSSEWQQTLVSRDFLIQGYTDAYYFYYDSISDKIVLAKH